ALPPGPGAPRAQLDRLAPRRAARARAGDAARAPRSRLPAGDGARVFPGRVPEERAHPLRARDAHGAGERRGTLRSRPGVAARLAQVPGPDLARPRDRKPVVGRAP